MQRFQESKQNMLQGPVCTSSSDTVCKMEPRNAKQGARKRTRGEKQTGRTEAHTREKTKNRAHGSAYEHNRNTRRLEMHRAGERRVLRVRGTAAQCRESVELLQDTRCIAARACGHFCCSRAATRTRHDQRCTRAATIATTAGRCKPVINTRRLWQPQGDRTPCGPTQPQQRIRLYQG